MDDSVIRTNGLLRQRRDAGWRCNTGPPRGQSGQGEPVLDEVAAQHALQTEEWAAIADLGLVCVR